MGLQDSIVDPKKHPAGQPDAPKKPAGDLGLSSTVDEFFTRLQSDMRHPSQSGIQPRRHADDATPCGRGFRKSFL
jgi:hypothetical protein